MASDVPGTPSTACIGASLASTIPYPVSTPLLCPLFLARTKLLSQACFWDPKMRPIWSQK